MQNTCTVKTFYPLCGLYLKQTAYGGQEPEFQQQRNAKDGLTQSEGFKRKFTPGVCTLLLPETLPGKVYPEPGLYRTLGIYHQPVPALPG